MNWAQTAAIIVAIVAAIGVSAGGIYTSLNGLHAQMAAIQAQVAANQAEAAADRHAMREEAAADRRAMQAAMDVFRTEMLRLAERQSHLEGQLAGRGASAD